MTTAIQLPNPALETPLIYKVKPGDTVSHIIHTYYDEYPGSPRYPAAVQFLQLYNPHVTNIDHLRAGDMLRLMPLEASDGLSYCPAPADYLAQLDQQTTPLQAPYNLLPSHQALDSYRTAWPDNPSEEAAFWALGMLQENYNWLAIPGGTALGAPRGKQFVSAGRGACPLHIGLKAGYVNCQGYLRCRPGEAWYLLGVGFI